jgi:hypothetical protein
MNYLRGFVNYLTPIIKDIDIFKETIIFDGIIESILFFKSYFSYKINHCSFEDFMNRTTAYSLPIVERYIYYYTISNISHYFLMIMNLQEDLYINKIIVIILCTPYIQRFILKDRIVNKYIERKHLFFKYSFAKLFLKFVSKLDENICGIRNYHTFIFSRYINIKLIKSTFKTAMFIILLYTLRENQSTYYYYKAIKLSYFYNQKYLFNVMNRNNAVAIINDIIKKKNWGDLNKEEVANAFYNLITENMITVEKLDINKLKIMFLFFSSIWSILCFINLIEIKIISLIIYISFCINGLIFEVYNIKFFNKLCIAGIISCYSCYLINEFFSTILFFSIIYNTIPQYIIGETWFFLNNYKNIEKVIKFYDKNK